MNGIDGWEGDQFYRVMLAMVTAAVTALALTVFSAVAEPTKSSARVSADRVDDRLPDVQMNSSEFVATEWW